VTKTAVEINALVSEVKSVDDNFAANGAAQGDNIITVEIVNITSFSGTRIATLPAAQWSDVIVANTSGDQIFIYVQVGDTFQDGMILETLNDGDTYRFKKYTSSKVMRMNLT